MLWITDMSKAISAAKYVFAIERRHVIVWCNCEWMQSRIKVYLTNDHLLWDWDLSNRQNDK